MPSVKSDLLAPIPRLISLRVIRYKSTRGEVVWGAGQGVGGCLLVLVQADVVNLHVGRQVVTVSHAYDSQI